MACRPEEQKRLTVVPATDVGSPARKRRDARHVRPLLAFGISAADDHVLDLGRADLRHPLEDRLDAVGHHVVRPRDIERTAERLGQRRPQTFNDNSFACHVFLTPRSWFHSAAHLKMVS